MTAVLADTHTIVGYLAPPGNLSASAVQALDGATQAGDLIPNDNEQAACHPERSEGSQRPR